MSEETKRVIVIMDKEQHNDLKKIAKKMDWNVSGICRKAIKDYLKGCADVGERKGS